MGGGSIKKPTQKRSINFTTETLETLDKLAAKNHTTTSELVRGYVEKGLSIEGSREDIDFIARIIRQEITAVYHVDEIKAIADHDTDRLAKMLMKIGKINGAIFFLLYVPLLSCIPHLLRMPYLTRRITWASITKPGTEPRSRWRI